jgi:predicted transcriptional regulator
MSNTPIFSLRLVPGTKAALSVIARQEHRSLGNLINRALEEYIESRGFQHCPGCHGSGVEGQDEDGEPVECDDCRALGFLFARARDRQKERT